MNPERFILVVEDCDEAVTALQIALEAFFGCPVVHAPDGLRARELLKADRNTLLAMITDLNLPGLDGYRLIEYVRRDLRLEDTPVVVISADADPRTSERVLAMGADAFFPKPYSPAGVCQSLENILHAKRKLVPSDDNPADDGSGAARGTNPA
jgi:two-component system chemotaxis response regulator CheY